MNPEIEHAKSDVDSYTLPCGYVDADKNVHTDIVVHGMTGEDEDTLAAKNMPTTKKVNKILVRCTESIGPYSGASLEKIIPDLTQGDRIYLLISIRRVSLGNDMPFQTTCPSCKAEGRFVMDLGDLETKKMENPAVRNYDLVLPEAKSVVRMKVLTGRGEEAISKAANQGNDVISTAIFARIESINDKPPTIRDMKSMSIKDRNFLRNEWEDHEGGVDTALQIDCPSCSFAYETELDISQPGFFNPSGTLSLWKKKYSFSWSASKD